MQKNLVDPSANNDIDVWAIDTNDDRWQDKDNRCNYI